MALGVPSHCVHAEASHIRQPMNREEHWAQVTELLYMPSLQEQIGEVSLNRVLSQVVH